MTSTSVKCRCQHCDNFLEFDSGRAGEVVNCPGCGMETILFVPAAGVQSSPLTFQRPAPLKKEFHSSAPPILRMTACRDCGAAVSRRAVICPKCGMVPSLWRIGWYVFVIMGVIGFIGAIFIFAADVMNDAAGRL